MNPAFASLGTLAGIDTVPATEELDVATDLAHSVRLADEARREHERACLAHARRGGSWDTRPVYLHPARRTSENLKRAAVLRREMGRVVEAMR